MAKVLKKRRSRYFFQNDQRKSLVAPLPKRQKRHLRLAHHEAGQNGGLSNQWPHEQPTFGPQRYPKSAAWQVYNGALALVTEGWLNMRQQLFVRIVVFSMRNQPERSRRGRIFIGGRGFLLLGTLLNASSNFAENFSK